jgi:hypothetical protein
MRAEGGRRRAKLDGDRTGHVVAAAVPDLGLFRARIERPAATACE